MPEQMTCDDWRAVAKASINAALGADTYEMCEMFHDRGVSQREIGRLFRLGQSAVCTRINGAHVKLRAISREAGINILPKSWEAVAEQVGS